MVKNLLIATTNHGKLEEIKKYIPLKFFKPFSLSEFFLEKIPVEPKEDGASFSENAVLKARYYGDMAQMLTIADDSGLCVCDLGNRPGIYSARYAMDKSGKTNFELAAQKIFKELEELKISINSAPKAFFVCGLAIYDPILNDIKVVEGRVDGFLTNPRGDFGFGYDPIFVKNGMNQSFAEINKEQKDKISHRAVAFKELAKILTRFESSDKI